MGGAITVHLQSIGASEEWHPVRTHASVRRQHNLTKTSGRSLWFVGCSLFLHEVDCGFALRLGRLGTLSILDLLLAIRHGCNRRPLSVIVGHCAAADSTTAWAEAACN